MNERFFVGLFALSLLAPATLFAQSQTAEQPTPAECVKLCAQDADNVPPACDCSPAGGAGTSEERTVLDLLNDIRAGYIAQMATIENYWIVEASDSSPYPVTRYFERKPGADSNDPRYREVPPDELARREILNDPRYSEEEKQAFSDPAGIYGGYAEAMDAFGEATGEATGGATSGAFDGLANAFRGVEAGARADQAKKEAEAGESGGIPRLIQMIEDMILHTELDETDSLELQFSLFWPLRPPAFAELGRNCNDFDPEIQPRFVSWDRDAGEACPEVKDLYDRLVVAYREYLSGQRPQMPNLIYGVPCVLVRVVEDIDISFGSNDYTLQTGSEFWWINTQSDTYPPAYYKMQLLTLDVGGYRQVTLEREMFIHRPAGPMIVPREIRERIKGLVGGLIEEHKSIRSVGFNQGPPTQEQIQQSTW